MGVDLHIVFDTPGHVYLSGSCVQGRVVGRTTEVCTTKGVSLECHGEINAHSMESRDYRERRGSKSSRKKVTYYYESTQQLFHFPVYLYGNGVNPISLPAGAFTFPFKFTLPPNLPSSYESSGGCYGGYIRYTVQATLDRPGWFNSNANAAANLNVSSYVDLNQSIGLMNPVQSSDQKAVGHCCCKSGSISGQVQLPRGGFVPGEQINVAIVCRNDSSSNIKSVGVKLEQNAIFIAEFRRKTGDTMGYGAPSHRMHNREVEVEEYPLAFSNQVIPAHSSNNLNFVVLVPAVPCTTETGIINITYDITVSVTPEGTLDSYNRLDINAPIVIGSIPLRTT